VPAPGSPGAPADDFAQKRACVVGGTSGIGAAIASALIARGAEVWVTGASEATAAEMAARHPALAARAHALDLRDRAQIGAYCARFAGLDILINAAGASFPGRECEPAVLLDAIAINLSGIAQVTLAMSSALRARKGCVVNFASLTSFLGSASNPAYSAAKGGIVQLTKSLARLWGPHGVRVNAVAPGYVRTRLTAFRWQDAAESRAVLARTPLARWGEAEDIVGPTLFLCSREAGFITGVVLPVDGGYLTS
jgi:NAD(P)-dependent dehydrogenase (short-subunit alcohol dehydrogenase family)